MIAALTVAIIGLAFGISLLPDPGLKLQVFYLLLAVTVFVSGYRSKSYLYLVLSILLFARWTLENIDYQWTPMIILASGHLTLAFVTLYVVLDAKERILLYFPALMACQFLSDILYIEYGFSYYGYIHNVLAIMQMSAFIVLAWQRRKIPTTTDPIVNLMSKLYRDWLAWRQSDAKSWRNV